LTPSKHRAKTTDGAGTASDTDGTPGEDADDPTGNVSDPPVEYAKDRARDRLKRLTTVETDELRGEFLRDLGRELDSIDDVVTVFERVRGTGPEYLIRPYETRFNTDGRAGQNLRRLNRAFDRATERYDKAVMVTLTTDPKRHDSLLEATDALLENKNRLAGWLAYDPEGDDRPDRPGERLPKASRDLLALSRLSPGDVLARARRLRGHADDGGEGTSPRHAVSVRRGGPLRGLTQSRPAERPVSRPGDGTAPAVIPVLTNVPGNNRCVVG